MTKVIRMRNYFGKMAYRGVVKPVCFSFDPEKVHNHFTKTGKLLESNKFSRKLTSCLFNYQNPMLEQKILGIKFRNPVGLSAGFDKNAELIDIMEDVGFGFVEVGSITAKGGKGNPGIRLKRFPEKKSLWINLGLNNNGVEEIVSRLRKRRGGLTYGVSIAYTNCKENADDKNATEDYLFSLEKARGVGDYIVLNISCPNTYGGQPFTRINAYKGLLERVNKLKIKAPIFVKISPDLDNKTVDSILELSHKYGIKGVICTNLTKKHDLERGGMSGKYLEKKANELLIYVYKKKIEKKYKFMLVGVGGIFSAEDAYRKIKLGANLIQLVTGMIYMGPGVISEINMGIVNLMKKEGYKNVSEVVGKDLN